MVRALHVWHGARPLVRCVTRLPASCCITDPYFRCDRGRGAALLSVVIFRETLTLMTEAGICLIIAWVVLISVSHQ